MLGRGVAGEGGAVRLAMVPRHGAGEPPDN